MFGRVCRKAACFGQLCDCTGRRRRRHRSNVELATNPRQRQNAAPNHGTGQIQGSAQAQSPAQNLGVGQSQGAAQNQDANQVTEQTKSALSDYPKLPPLTRSYSEQSSERASDSSDLSGSIGRRSRSPEELESSSGSSKRVKAAGEFLQANRDFYEIDDERVDYYRQQGILYQSWIEDPNVPQCKVRPATLTAEEYSQSVEIETYTTAEVDNRYLDGGDPDSAVVPRPAEGYRYIGISLWGSSNIWNNYAHLQSPGIIIANNIFRTNGPHWNEIAKAWYEIDADISTLRHVVFEHVVNEETMPYVKYELYPRYHMSWENADGKPCKKLERGTREYEELLGTQLGKAAACLVLSSFTRGSMIISRIVTWAYSDNVMVRFDLAEVTAPGI